MKVVELKNIMPKMEALRVTESVRGKSTGYSNLDEYYTVIQGKTTIIEGRPTSGKTSFTFQLQCNLSATYGWKHVIYSPETGHAEDVYSEIYHCLTGKTFNKKFSNHISEHEMYSIESFITDHFKVIESRDNLTVDQWYEMATQAISEYEINTVSIDNWNDLVHNVMAFGNISEYLKIQIPRFNNFCENFNVHGFLLAHPRNPDMRGQKYPPPPRPDELEGGSLWYAKAQSLLVVDHDWSDPNNYATQIIIHKVKPKAVGKKGFVELQYAAALNCYYEENGVLNIYPKSPFKELNNYISDGNPF